MTYIAVIIAWWVKLSCNKDHPLFWFEHWIFFGLLCLNLPCPNVVMSAVWHEFCFRISLGHQIGKPLNCLLSIFVQSNGLTISGKCFKSILYMHDLTSLLLLFKNEPIKIWHYVWRLETGWHWTSRRAASKGSTHHWRDIAEQDWETPRSWAGIRSSWFWMWTQTRALCSQQVTQQLAFVYLWIYIDR